jgi:hypothetical protein
MEYLVIFTSVGEKFGGVFVAFDETSGLLR